MDEPGWLGVGGLIWAGSLYLLKLLVDRSIDKRFENDKAEFQAKLDAQGKHYQAQLDHSREEAIKILEDRLGRQRDVMNKDLRIAAFMHETRFAALTARQMEAMEQLYGLLWELQAAAVNLTKILQFASDGTPEEREQRQLAAYNKARDELGTFMRKMGLYCEPAVYKLAEIYAKTLSDAVYDWMGARSPGMQSPKKWKEAVDTVRDKGEALLELIADRLQANMGMENTKAEPLPGDALRGELPGPATQTTLPLKQEGEGRTKE